METEKDSQDEMEQLLTCKICHLKYHDPIILPCFKTVCCNHVFSDNNDSFKCDFCKEEHNLKNDRFPMDENMIKFAKISSNFINIDKIKI